MSSIRIDISAFLKRTSFRFLIVATLPASLLLAQHKAGQWQFLGLGGRIVQKLRLHEGHLYAATDNGLYRKDLQFADTLWTPIGLQGKRTRALWVFDSDTLLASTEFDTVSLYQTIDGGMTWRPFQNGFGGGSPETVMALARHPDQPHIIFGTGATVVAKSLDRGQSWLISYGSWQGFATGTNFVVIDRNDPQIIWAGGQNAVERAFLLKSPDGGATWQEWHEIVNEVSSANTVAIHPNDSETVYAGLESFILKTTDGGNTWQEIYEEPGRFFFGIALNPTRPERMYAASWFKTPDPQPLILFIMKKT